MKIRVTASFEYEVDTAVYHTEDHDQILGVDALSVVDIVKDAAVDGLLEYRLLLSGDGEVTLAERTVPPEEE